MKKFIFTTLLFCAAAASAAPRPKLIDLSWSNPTVAFLQKNLAQMEANAPVDGITIRVWGERVATTKGKKFFAGKALWSDAKIELKHFAKDIAILKKLPFKKFTDNFYYMTTIFYHLDWYNDVQWAQAAANFGVAAKVSRITGLKGILFDIEEYGKRFWDYNLLENKKMDYEATCKVVFKRGQQWGKEVFGNYPEIIIFMPFMFSMYSGNLSAPFINGIISVMPPTARIIEGYESDGYRAGKPEDYDAIAKKYYNNAVLKAYPANKNKYLTQVELAPSFYIDSIVRHNRFDVQKKACGGVNNFLRRNLSAAKQVAGNYIWLYSEKGVWWENTFHPQAKQTWEEQVPGITKTIRDIMDNKLVFQKDNLLKNPDFKLKTNWYRWQRKFNPKKNEPGVITVGNGKAVFKNVRAGSVSQGVRVKPGEYYLFQFRGANRSGGYAHGFIAFKDKNGKWLDFIHNFTVPLPKTGKFEDVKHLFTVPEGAAIVTVQLSAGCQGLDNNGEVIYAGVQLLKR